jgi:hypothetical protein
MPSRRPDDPHYRRLRYVRYADDHLLGFIGSRTEALEIKQKIQEFLKSLKLTLSEEKTLITHATRGRARFLGYEIYIAQNNTKLTNHKNQARCVKRSINGKPILSVPTDVVKKWQTHYLGQSL